MKTIIFDIDGTLTEMRPLENRLVTQRTFKPVQYPLVEWIKKNKDKYSYVYATGGQRSETECALKKLGIIHYFDLKNSISKTNCRFSKKTGIPFKKILKKYPNSMVITDTQADCLGARKAGIQSVLIKN